MALTKMNTDLNIIAALDDEPNSVGGLSATELKAKFDESGNAIKTYINETLTAETDAHIENTDNPHTVTAAQVGLGNCDNTADIDKPVSTPQQEALNLKANSDNVLEKNNVAEYNPTANYHPATKKYVDDTVGQAVLGSIPDGTITEVKLDASLTEKINRSRNLLDNWYFANPVDQRGGYVVKPGAEYFQIDSMTVSGTTTAYYKVIRIDSDGNPTFSIDGTNYWTWGANMVRGYTGAGYGIDRWFINEHGTLLINDDCISIEGMHRQFIENGVEKFCGKRCCFSVLTKDGELFSGHEIVPTNGTNNFYSANDVLLCSYSDGNTLSVLMETYNGKFIQPIAAKLELGTQQTLAHQENGVWVLNEIPDYGEQLARCQRYFYKPNKVVLIRTPNTNSCTINASFMTTMRTAPTVAFGTEMTALVPGVTSSAKVSLQYAHIGENGIGDGDFISFTPADAEIFQVEYGQFSFSADL